MRFVVQFQTNEGLPEKVSAAAPSKTGAPGFFQSALTRTFLAAGIASTIGLPAAVASRGWNASFSHPIHRSAPLAPFASSTPPMPQTAAATAPSLGTAFFQSSLVRQTLLAGTVSSVGQPAAAPLAITGVTRSSFSVIVRRPTFEIRQMPPSMAAIPNAAPVGWTTSFDAAARGPFKEKPFGGHTAQTVPPSPAGLLPAPGFFHSALSRPTIAPGAPSAVSRPASATQTVSRPVGAAFSVIVRRPTFQVRILPPEQAAVPLAPPSGWTVSFDLASIKPRREIPAGGFQPQGVVPTTAPLLPAPGFFHSALMRTHLRSGAASSVFKPAIAAPAPTIVAAPFEAPVARPRRSAAFEVLATATKASPQGWRDHWQAPGARRLPKVDFSTLGLQATASAPTSPSDGWRRAFFDLSAVRAFPVTEQAFSAIGLKIAPPTGSAGWGETQMFAAARTRPLRASLQAFAAFQPQGRIVSTTPYALGAFFDMARRRPAIISDEQRIVPSPRRAVTWGYATAFYERPSGRARIAGTASEIVSSRPVVRWGFAQTFDRAATPRAFSPGEIAQVRLRLASVSTGWAVADAAAAVRRRGLVIDAADGSTRGPIAPPAPRQFFRTPFDTALIGPVPAEIQQWASFQPRGRIKVRPHKHVIICGDAHSTATVQGIAVGSATVQGVAVAKTVVNT